MWYCYTWYGWLRKKEINTEWKNTTVAEYGSKVTKWIIQRLLALYFLRGLSSCHKTIKDRKQIVGRIESGTRDWKERDCISSGSLACAIADEHSWSLFEELGWHPANTTREREAQAESKAREREREWGREQDGKKHKQTEGLSSGGADRLHSELHPLAFCTDTGPLAPPDLYRCP